MERQRCCCFDRVCVCVLTVNCLDVHVAKDPNRVALIWEKDEPGTEERVTYRSDTFTF